MNQDIMELKEFKKIIGKSSVKNIIVGTGIFLFGVFIMWLILSGADSESDEIGVGGWIVLWILVGVCLLFGGVLTVGPVRDLIRVKSGKHPLVQAIESGDKGYIVWVYQHITNVDGGGSDHRIYTYTRDGKPIILALKEKRMGPVIKYLGAQFPNAVLGYTDEIKDQMSETFGKKL